MAVTCSRLADWQTGRDWQIALLSSAATQHDLSGSQWCGPANQALVGGPPVTSSGRAWFICAAVLGAALGALGSLGSRVRAWEWRVVRGLGFGMKGEGVGGGEVAWGVQATTITLTS